MGKERLLADLDILANMVAAMDEYLAASQLYGRSEHPDLPPVTLGGVCMRSQRLATLAPARLGPVEQGRLADLLRQLDEICARRREDFERKARQELAARLHLWQGHLQDMADEEGESPAYYATSVETRVLIAALLQELTQRRRTIPGELRQRLAELDRQLEQRWQPGAFVWPQEWQAAYPAQDYWWLYGLPGKMRLTAAPPPPRR
ncbi:MAG: hypothetical protein BWK76_14045 [Desulfobulbaceae bacterium A2]|nr:MAG: hypothetical protein BWK76_14045 [Desulfobulbaceae bacterium A2]